MNRNKTVAAALCLMCSFVAFGGNTADAQPSAASSEVAPTADKVKPMTPRQQRRAERRAARKSARLTKNAELAKIESENARPAKHRSNLPSDVQSLQTKSLTPPTNAAP